MFQHCPSEGPEAIGRMIKVLEREEKEEQDRLERKYREEGDNEK